MYDKIKLYLPRCRDMPDIAQYMDNGNEQTDITSGEVHTYGFIDGLRVSQFLGGYVVSGSLSRFFYPNNLYPLSYHTTAEAVEKLSDRLHLDMREANVTALEFGTQFPMAKPPSVYFSKLGDMSRKVRVRCNANTLYYQGVGRTTRTRQREVLAFYDKIADAKAKSMEIPKGLEDANLLKYELRLNGRLARQLGVQEVKASTLSDKGLFKLLLTKWSEDYFAISKLHTTKTDIMSEIRSPKDAINVFIARLMSKQEKDEIADFISELKRFDVFTDPKSYTRVKSKLKELSSNASLSVTDEDIRELDDCIRNTIANS